MELAITGSYPRPTQANTYSNDWKFYMQLPLEYRRFLTAQNGGSAAESRYTFVTGVPGKTDAVSAHSDCPIEFFGVPTTQQAGDWPEDLLQVIVDHEADKFLPRDVIAIARCPQKSLVCISLRKDDFGHIYYWDYDWQNPERKAFFDERISEVGQRYPTAQQILDTPNHPQQQQLMDELNDAVLVKLADSFDEWIRVCLDRRETGEVRE